MLLDDLIDVVGDHVIFIAPQALDDSGGNAVWGGQADLDFFIDMLRELSERGLQYNADKLFVVGHSNGGGFTHELGCAHGDVFRAIVPAAGGLSCDMSVR